MTIKKSIVAVVVVPVSESADQRIGAGEVPISIFITAVRKERHSARRISLPAESACGSSHDLNLVAANPEKSSGREAADPNIIE